MFAWNLSICGKNVDVAFLIFRCKWYSVPIIIVPEVLIVTTLEEIISEIKDQGGIID